MPYELLALPTLSQVPYELLALVLFLFSPKIFDLVSSSSKNCREVYGLTTSPFTSLTSSSEKLATGSAILLQSANNGYIRL